MNSESPCAPRSHPERRTEREKERKGKKNARGDQASVSEAYNFIFKRIFYTLTCTKREMKDAKSYRVSPNITSVLSLSKPGFFLHSFPTMLCTLSSGLGGLWTFYDSCLIKAAQPENLFSLEVFFLYISNLCQPQKVLN